MSAVVRDFVMDNQLEQIVNMNFCYIDIGRAAASLCQCDSSVQCFEWYYYFKIGRTSLEGDKRSGRSGMNITPEMWKNSSASA